MLPLYVYADECSNLLLSPIRPNCTINPTTKQGLFCGGNSPPSNCNVGGNQNILYTCQCDAQGQNCHKTASQDCSQLINNGICHVVGNPLFPDYCISFDVNPKTIGPTAGCTLDAASNLNCSETISAIGGPAGAQIPWSGTINLNGAILNPATGTVANGSNQTSTLTIPKQFCQTNPTAQGTVVYADSNNPTKNNVTITFSCGGSQPVPQSPDDSPQSYTPTDSVRDTTFLVAFILGIGLFISHL